jgi:hypothetical protein
MTVAVPKPTVTFAFTQPSIDSGTHPKLRYQASNLPIGSEIFLQLGYGTPRRWDFVKSLSGMTGSATLQSLPPGLYSFRAVVEQGIAVLASSSTRYLSVVQPPSSSCGVCEILGGATGAILAWLLAHIPWYVP